MKEIIYLGDTEKELWKFSDAARQRILAALTDLSLGVDLSPIEFKYMQTVGMGVYELRIKVDKQYPVFYVTKFEEAIYILHVFVKKTPQTSRHDIQMGITRYKALLNERRKQNYDRKSNI